MKITAFEARIVRVPVEDPLAHSFEPPGSTRPTVTLRLRTDAGIEGIGFSFLGAGLTRAVHAAVEDLAALLVGHDPLARQTALRKLRDAGEGAGPAGVFTLAMAAIDIALWDIAGKAVEQPLWRMLGGSGDKVPTYASGGLMRELDDAAAEQAAARLVEAGFTAMKMQLALPGKPGVAAELRRARLVRDAIGPEIALMCDMNARWRPDEAMAIGARLEDIGFTWLEDITSTENVDHLGRVAAQLATPLACGEYLYGIGAFRALLAADAADIVMIDPFRAGGITGWLKIAALADGFGLPVVSHLAPEIQVHMIGSIPNGMTLEYMPWSVRLFEEVPWPEKGWLTPPRSPGLGLRFDDAALARFAA